MKLPFTANCNDLLWLLFKGQTSTAYVQQHYASCPSARLFGEERRRERSSSWGWCSRSALGERKFLL